MTTHDDTSMKNGTPFSGGKVRSVKWGRGFRCPVESKLPKWGITTPLCPVAQKTWCRTGPKLYRSCCRVSNYGRRCLRRCLFGCRFRGFDFGRWLCSLTVNIGQCLQRRVFVCVTVYLYYYQLLGYSRCSVVVW